MEQNELNLPLVSVVMPLYNAEKFVKKAIDSVLNQTYKNFELIIVDDCSSDGSLEIVKKLANNNEEIKIISNKENSGVSKTRNKGILEANGEYIALLDSDDIWTEEKLEKQVALLLNNEAQIVYCSYGFINENDQPIKKPFIVPEKTNFHKMLTKSVISCSTALIKTDLLKNNLFDEKYYHEDYVLWMTLLSDGAKAIGSKEVLAHYRQVSNSRSSDKKNSALHRWKIYREVLNLSLIKSTMCFIGYIFFGMVKYYL